ncbi:hypothetical protein [Planomonospora sp. ID82291]|uniref:hypothetical protein n=1 Tax=Planomonospora sp. ID82291 TaxID=2738136 RepID=UPI001E4E0D68|nr:hypothetical protein [Planomonospora sp. ID82291]
MLTALGLGAVIGVLLGLLGGGSILAVPALVHGADLPRIRAGQVRWRIAAVIDADALREPSGPGTRCRPFVDRDDGPVLRVCALPGPWARAVQDTRPLRRTAGRRDDGDEGGAPFGGPPP